MVLVGSEEIEVGDVIVFNGDAEEPIIHRVVKLDGIQTKGDRNFYSRSDEININKDRILGKAIFRIPFLGWIKLVFVKAVNLFVGINF